MSGDPVASFNQKVTRLRSDAKKEAVGQPPYFDRRLFSLGLFQSWLFLVFHSSAIISLESSAYNLVYSWAIIFALLVLILGAFIRYRRRSRVFILILGTVCGILGTIAIHYFPFEDLALVIESAFLGIGIGTFIPFVGKIFSSANLGIATRQTFLSFAFAALLYFLILGFPEVVATVVISLLPLILALVILDPVSASRSKRHHAELTAPDEVSEIIRSRPVIVFFVGAGLLGLAFGFSMAFCSLYGLYTFNAANRWSVLITGIGALLYSFIMRPTKRTFDFERCFSPVAPIIAIGLLLFPYESFISSILIIMGFQLADMVVWIVFSWIAGHSGLSQRVFCIGKSSMYAGMLIGAVVVRFAPLTPDGGSFPLVAASIGTYLLILAIIFIFNNSKVTFAIKASSRNSDLSYIAKAIELRCEELGQKYGLTAREKEILVYLVQGRSLPYIESAMHISHGTANSHRDHIYLKTKVHSKQALLDLFFGHPT